VSLRHGSGAEVSRSLRHHVGTGAKVGYMYSLISEHCQNVILLNEIIILPNFE